MRTCMTGNQNARKNDLSRETLVQLYVVERLSIAEIGRRTGCGTVHRELARLDIPRRGTCKTKILPTVKPTIADKAYAAGFFDGEGSMNIRNPGSTIKNPGYSLTLNVAQSCEAPLIWLSARWGGSVRPMKRPKPVWEWNLGSLSASKFLQDILPFLMVKQEQALVAIEFQSHKKNTGRRRDPESISRERESKEKLQSLR
jgi:hypothetical protein